MILSPATNHRAIVAQSPPDEAYTAACSSGALRKATDTDQYQPVDIIRGTVEFADAKRRPRLICRGRAQHREHHPQSKEIPDAKAKHWKEGSMDTSERLTRIMEEECHVDATCRVDTYGGRWKGEEIAIELRDYFGDENQTRY